MSMARDTSFVIGPPGSQARKDQCAELAARLDLGADEAWKQIVQARLADFVSGHVDSDETVLDEFASRALRRPVRIRGAFVSYFMHRDGCRYAMLQLRPRDVVPLDKGAGVDVGDPILVETLRGVFGYCFEAHWVFVTVASSEPADGDGCAEEGDDYCTAGVLVPDGYVVVFRGDPGWLYDADDALEAPASWIASFFSEFESMLNPAAVRQVFREIPELESPGTDFEPPATLPGVLAALADTDTGGREWSGPGPVSGTDTVIIIPADRVAAACGALERLAQRLQALVPADDFSGVMEPFGVARRPGQKSQ